MKPSSVMMELSSPVGVELSSWAVSAGTEVVAVLGFTVTGGRSGPHSDTVSFSTKSFSSHTCLITSVLVQVEVFIPSSLHWCAQVGDT